MGLYEFGQWTGEKAAAVNAKIDAFNGAVKDANANADLTFASLINATADGFNVALERTIPAFLEGRTMEGAAGVLEMIGSLTPMLGAFGGPAGGAAGGLVSMALGIVSAIGAPRPVVAGEPILASITLRPGNSGGALADSQGRVVGVPYMVIGPGLALAVSSRAVNWFVKEGWPFAGLMDEWSMPWNTEVA